MTGVSCGHDDGARSGLKVVAVEFDEAARCQKSAEPAAPEEIPVIPEMFSAGQPFDQRNIK